MRSKKNMIKRLVSLLLCSAICVVAAAAADNDLSGWAYVRGCKPLVEGADIIISCLTI